MGFPPTLLGICFFLSDLAYMWTGYGKTISKPQGFVPVRIALRLSLLDCNSARVPRWRFCFALTYCFLTQDAPTTKPSCPQGPGNNELSLRPGLFLGPLLHRVLRSFILRCTQWLQGLFVSRVRVNLHYVGEIKLIGIVGSKTGKCEELVTTYVCRPPSLQVDLRLKYLPRGHFIEKTFWQSSCFAFLRSILKLAGRLQRFEFSELAQTIRYRFLQTTDIPNHRTRWRTSTTLVSRLSWARARTSKTGHHA